MCNTLFTVFTAAVGAEALGVQAGALVEATCAKQRASQWLSLPVTDATVDTGCPDPRGDTKVSLLCCKLTLPKNHPGFLLWLQQRHRTPPPHAVTRAACPPHGAEPGAQSESSSHLRPAESCWHTEQSRAQPPVQPSCPAHCCWTSPCLRLALPFPGTERHSTGGQPRTRAARGTGA